MGQGSCPREGRAKKEAASKAVEPSDAHVFSVNVLMFVIDTPTDGNIISRLQESFE